MIKIDVPYISQKDLYPTGCESVSSVMLLHHLNYNVTVDEFIGRYLDCRPFFKKDGQLYGPDPRRFFCGSPYSEDDFGCYAPVIVNALNKIFCKTRRFEAADETGTPMETLLHRYIDQGMPVIFWASIDMKEPVIGPSWKIDDTGEPFTWISNEHCMLLIGYDEEGYYFNDPYEGHGVMHYPKELTLNRHKAQYEMAVGVRILK